MSALAAVQLIANLQQGPSLTFYKQAGRQSLHVYTMARLHSGGPKAVDAQKSGSSRQRRKSEELFIKTTLEAVKKSKLGFLP